jgi:serpin B
MPGADSTFAGHLYGQLSSRSGNLVFSPASIQLGLGMAYAGARGETASEMERALALGPQSHATFAELLRSWERLGHPEEDPDRVRIGPPPELQELYARIATRPEMQELYEAELARRRIVLRVVDRLWAQSGYRFLDEFLALIRDQYRAPLAGVDFHRDPEAAREQINAWVSTETGRKITELVPRGLVTGETRLLISNALYFKAQWSSEFEESETREQPFFAEGTREVRVPLMRRVGKYPLAAFATGQFLEMPYASGGLAMDVVLPADRNGLAGIERQFASGALPGWLDALKSSSVDLTLPRFKTSSGFELAQSVGALGMHRAFKYRDADFSGMDGTRELYISALAHQAIVDVDEHGTEAVAATAIRTVVLGRPLAPVLFRADHPFLFLIRDMKSGVILFVGRVVDPDRA